MQRRSSGLPANWITCRVESVEKEASTAPLIEPVARCGALGEKATVAVRCACQIGGMTTARVVICRLLCWGCQKSLSAAQHLMTRLDGTSMVLLQHQHQVRHRHSGMCRALLQHLPPARFPGAFPDDSPCRRVCRLMPHCQGAIEPTACIISALSQHHVVPDTTQPHRFCFRYAHHSVRRQCATPAALVILSTPCMYTRYACKSTCQQPSLKKGLNPDLQSDHASPTEFSAIAAPFRRW